MVHYIGKSLADRKRGDYWKLDIYPSTLRTALATTLSDKHGLQVSSSSFNLTRLKYLLSRADRGMLLYDKCSKDELDLFCQQRKIKFGVGQKAIEKLLVAALEAEDEDNAKFEKFVDLPAELRLRVYDYYLNSIRQDPYCTSHDGDGLVFWSILPPPPLAQSSQLLRSETFDLFYRIVRFRVLNWSDARSAELKVTPKHLLQALKKIRIDGSIRLDDGNIALYDSWHLDLPIAHKPASVHRRKANLPKVFPRRAYIPAPDIEELSTQVSTSMQHFLDDLMVRPSADLHLGVDDFKALRRVFPVSFNTQ